jgi:hypothetical protein
MRAGHELVVWVAMALGAAAGCSSRIEPSDTGVDAFVAPDGGSDAGTDAGVDTGTDAGHDAGTDAFVEVDANLPDAFCPDAGPRACVGLMHLCACSTCPGFYCLSAGAMCIPSSSPCP